MRWIVLLSSYLVAACNGSTGVKPPTKTERVATNKTTAQPAAAPRVSCMGPAVHGPVRYVAITGNDHSGDGSTGKPWATIAHAINTVKDGTTILVGPGTYTGRVRLDKQFVAGVTIRAKPMYQARLRNRGTVVTIYEGKGITLEGFDIAHSGPGAKALVVQIQDLIGDAGGKDATSRITLRNNILHDSYANDILKINNGAKNILVERNIFYNQEGSDEHIDINSVSNVTVRDNVFFNDFAASGRKNKNDTSSFIVIKDSNDDDDSYMGAQGISIRRNVFLNWQGNHGENFVLVGEDGQKYYEARQVAIENNLLLGNSKNYIRAPFGIKGARDITIRNNTIVGNLPGNAFAFRFNVEGDNQPNDNIGIYNNIWSDPTGTMADFSDTPKGETNHYVLDNNLYWNNGKAIPSDPSDLINFTDDKHRVVKDPRLPALGHITPPSWDASAKKFRDGSRDICAAFRSLVTRFATPGAGSPAIHAGRANQSPADDILGRPRGKSPSIGAFERQ